MYKVRFIESEAGWGQDIWYNEYKTKEEEALKAAKENNDEFLGESVTPAYYIRADYIGE